MSDERASQEHWNEVWRRANPTRVSWFETSPIHSLAMIQKATGGETSRRIIDVGAGLSRLLSTLLDAGYKEVTGVDIAEPAVRALSSMLEGRASVIQADVRHLDHDGVWDVWHDRAVFHFMTTPDDRKAYADSLHGHLAPGGHAVLAVFAPDGPERCSGLPTMRYDGAELANVLNLTLVEERRVTHHKPNGDPQAFCYALLRRDA